MNHNVITDEDQRLSTNTGGGVTPFTTKTNTVYGDNSEAPS